MYNFAIVGVLAVFYQKGFPTWITQAYLVATSVIVAWQLSNFNDWMAWALLIMLAFYGKNARAPRPSPSRPAASVRLPSRPLTRPSSARPLRPPAAPFSRRVEICAPFSRRVDP